MLDEEKKYGEIRMKIMLRPKLAWDKGNQLDRRKI